MEKDFYKVHVRQESDGKFTVDEKSKGKETKKEGVSEADVMKMVKSNKNNGEVINIGSQKPIKIKNLILKIVNLIGKGQPNFSKIRIRSDEPIKLYPNISKAKKVLNWFPKYSLENGLKKTINYYKKYDKKN